MIRVPARSVIEVVSVPNAGDFTAYCTKVNFPSCYNCTTRTKGVPSQEIMKSLIKTFKYLSNDDTILT